MKIGKKLEELGQKYKEYKAKAPQRRRQRHQQRIEKLTMKNEEKDLQMQLELKNNELEQSRTKRQLAKVEMIERKNKAFKDMPKIGI